MTLVELLVATAIFAVVFGSVLTGLRQAAYRANWATCNIEASKLAEQRLEQMQNARWDLTASPTIDQLVSSNFPTVAVSLLTYTTGTSLIATNWVTITTLPSTNSPQYKVLVSSVRWTYRSRGPFTNTVTSIRAMDQ